MVLNLKVEKVERSELPHREDFYFRDKSGKEIPHEFESLTRNFLREVWASDFYLLNKKRINYALKLAWKSHAGQTRRERNLPYLIHPVEAAFRAFRNGDSAAAVIELCSTTRGRTLGFASKTGSSCGNYFLGR